MFSGDFFKAQSIVSGEDIKALEAYNKLLEDTKQIEAFDKTMKNASTTAQNLAKSAKGAAVDINNIPKASKAAAAGLKLLSVAGNMLLYMAIAKGIQWILTFNERLEESRQKMIEAGQEASQLTKDLDGLVEQYRKLGADGKFDNSDREQARSIQEQINALLGDEAHYIDLSNGSYKHQLELLRRLQHEQANAKYATIKDAKEAAETSLRSKISNVGVGNNIAKTEVEAIEKLSRLPEMDKYLKTYDGDEQGRGKFAIFSVDTSSTEAMIASYEKMIELRNILSKSYADEIKKGGSLEDFYNNLTNEIDELSDAVTKYKDAIDDYNINEAVVQFNETEFDGIKGALIKSKEEMASWAKAMLESEDISDGVKENLIGLAKTYYPDLSDAMNESIQAFHKKKYAEAESTSEIENHIKNLDAEADQCGLTKKAYIELISTEILFNNTNLNITQKVSALQQLAYQAGITADKMREALMFDSLQKAYDTATYGIEASYRAGRITKEERDAKKAQILSELNSSLYDGYEDGANEDIFEYSPEDDGKGSEKNEALDNYLKDAENRYKIHQDETKYIQDLQYAYDNLTKKEEERLDITGKINEVYRDLADNRIKDIEHQIDLAKELNEYADVTDYYKQIQKVSHEEANRLRAMGYDDNSNEIQDLQKKWWDAQNKIADESYSNSERWISKRNTYNDWKLFDDSEVDAWERVVKWLKEDYPNDLEKIKEAEQNLFEARKKEFDKGTDFGNTYLESQKTLLQSHFDVTNSIAEARHELNKELKTSLTMTEYLDEETRKLLFNQEDYNKLGAELNRIEGETLRLQAEYEDSLRGATLETIESITSNYQMQYETLMKSYEIAKADLEIAKKKAKLNNVLNERNVRMFINGSWQWVADAEQVANAKSELADAEYAKRVEEAGLTQQNSINDLTKQQDELGVVINDFESGVISLNEAVSLASHAIGYIPQAMRDMLNDAMVDTNSYSSGSSSRSYNGTWYDSNTDYMSNILSASSASEVRLNNAARNAKIQGDGRSEGIMTDAEAIDLWRKAKGHATGTRYTPGGLTKMGEEGFEAYISANGRLIPINQPTIGNIPSGGVVFNAEQMKTLRTMWDMSNINFAGRTMPIGNPKQQQIDQSQDNRIIINGMTVDSGSADGQALISALRRYVGNH